MNEETQSKYDLSDQDLSELLQQIRSWSEELGFQQLGISDTNLFTAENKTQQLVSEQLPR